MSKKIAFIDGKTIIDGQEVARATPASNSVRPPNSGSAAYQHAMAAQRSKLGIEAPQASVDVLAQLKEINAANQKHINEQAAKVEALEEETETLNCHVKELNNKIAAFDRAPRNGGDGLWGSETVSNKARKDLGDFARGVRAAMSTDSNPDGGFIVTPEFDRTISQLSSQTSAMRRLASAVTIGTNAYIKTINMQGIGSGWVSERQSRPETAAFKLAQIELPVHELYAMPAITQAALDDSFVDAGAELELQIGKKLGAVEADSFINGNGVGKPYGLMSYATVADASWVWQKLGFIVSGHASSFVTPTTSASPADAIIDLVYALKPEYKANAVFLMNRKTASVVRKFKDADGRYIWSDSVISGQPDALLGYGVEIDDAMPDVAGGAYPIAFGDFKAGYVIVDRFGTRLVRDNLTQKPYVLFYTTRRVGGGVINYEAIKLLKIST